MAFRVPRHRIFTHLTGNAIAAYTHPGDAVMDPGRGAGTVMAEASAPAETTPPARPAWCARRPTSAGAEVIACSGRAV